jgi:hypothetical protein
MSSKTLAVAVQAGRLTGAVIESSIGAVHVGAAFDMEIGSPLPVQGPFDRVVATLPPEAAAFRLLPLPFRDRRRASLAVGPAIEEHVPYSLDDGVLAWDFASSGSDAAGATVLAAIADPARVEAARAELVALGIEAPPQRLVWLPTAILAAYRRALGEGASFTAVDLGDGGAVIARVDAGRVAALRVVAPCEDELLLRNTAWSLATVGESARVVVGGSRAARLGKALGQRLPGVAIEALPSSCPVEGFGQGDWRERTALVGLVLASGGDAPPPVLDFEASSSSILGLAALAEFQSEARPLMRWGVAALVLSVAAIGLDYTQLFVERRALSERAEQVYTSAIPSGSGGSGRKLKLEMKLRELTGKADTSPAGAAGSPLALMAALSRDVPKNLDIVLDQLDHVPPSAKVSGHAESFEAVTRMQEALTRAGGFSRVEVKDVHAAVTGGGVDFLLELTTAADGGGA